MISSALSSSSGASDSKPNTGVHPASREGWKGKEIPCHHNLEEFLDAYIQSADDSLKTWHKWGVKNIPAAFLIKDGKVIGQWTGTVNGKELAAAIEANLAKQSPTHTWASRWRRVNFSSYRRLVGLGRELA